MEYSTINYIMAQRRFLRRLLQKKRQHGKTTLLINPLSLSNQMPATICTCTCFCYVKRQTRLPYHKSTHKVKHTVFFWRGQQDVSLCSPERPQTSGKSNDSASFWSADITGMGHHIYLSFFLLHCWRSNLESYTGKKKHSTTKLHSQPVLCSLDYFYTGLIPEQAIYFQTY